jgi:hypothetical protein
MGLQHRHILLGAGRRCVRFWRRLLSRICFPWLVLGLDVMICIAPENCRNGQVVHKKVLF